MKTMPARGMLLIAVGVALLGGPAPEAPALDDGLARTPPMGWNSWNRFHCDVSEELIRSIADAIVERGLKDAGYAYVVIDDCWQVGRDASGRIVRDPERFPSGMGALAAYLHAKGLKFGLYSCAGAKTCQGRPGSKGFEVQDARQYAAWGVDYLKYDWCYAEGQHAETSYARMRDALKATGRPIIFSLCEWGMNKPWLWAREVGHLWRTTGDIEDSWESWTGILDHQVELADYAGPGHWNDPDMLEVGNGGMTLEEYRAHFSLWCILAAPLMMGHDVRSMTEEIRQLLTNPDVIAVNQDPLGRQGSKVRDDGEAEVWGKPLADGSAAVALLNRGQVEARITVSWDELGYASAQPAEVRDLWRRADLGRHDRQFSSLVPAHGVVLIKATPLQAAVQLQSSR